MILVAYASKHGATEGIAHAIAKRLDYRDLDAQAHTVHELEDVGRPEAVVLGSAVYAGSWMKDAVRFAEAHSLASSPSCASSSIPASIACSSARSIARS